MPFLVLALVATHRAGFRNPAAEHDAHEWAGRTFALVVVVAGMAWIGYFGSY